MNCQQIETLLAAFVAGDLVQAEASQVRSHVVTCDGCRESLAAYEKLEATLSMRQSFVPPVDRFIPNIASGVTQTVANGVVAYARARKWLDRLVSMPALVTTGFMMSGLATYFYRDKIAEAIGRDVSISTSLTQSLESIMATWTNTMSDIWILGGVCAGISIVVLLSTGVATARLLRH